MEVSWYRKCLAFVLVPILERELQVLKELWNTHTIRYNRRTEAPHGVPNDLYAMPSESGTVLANGSDIDCSVNRRD